MKRITVAGTLVLLVASASLLLLAPGAQADSSGKRTTLPGLVVDTACYIGHDSKGPDHAECARECAEGGIPLAILDTSTNTLYLPVGMNHKNPNDQLMPYVEKRVRVTGDVIEKSGMKGIVIEKVEPAGP